MSVKAKEWSDFKIKFEEMKRKKRKSMTQDVTLNLDCTFPEIEMASIRTSSPVVNAVSEISEMPDKLDLVQDVETVQMVDPESTQIPVDFKDPYDQINQEVSEAVDGAIGCPDTYSDMQLTQLLELNRNEFAKEKDKKKAFKYVEVCKSAERKKLHADSCPCCTKVFDANIKYYDALSDEKRKQEVSRHRSIFAAPDTPPGFWDVNFTAR